MSHNKAAGRAASLPTKDEQKQLQQVEALLKGNLVHLQVHELLTTVHEEASNALHKKKVHRWVQSVRDAAMSVAPSITGDVQLSQEWIDQCGFHESLHLVQYEKSILGEYAGAEGAVTMKYEEPIGTEILGSWELGTVTAPILNVDVAVIMSPELFEARDMLNHRYFDKRRLFLSGLLHSLQCKQNPQRPVTSGSGKKNKKRKLGAEQSFRADAEQLYSNIEIVLFKGDHRKPILQLCPPVPPFRGSSALRLRLIPVLPTAVFRLFQLRAEKNNVRPAQWLRQIQRDSSRRNSFSSNKTSKEPLAAAALPPTPEYNLAILEDVALLTEQLLISKAISAGATNLGDIDSDRQSVIAMTITLLKIWLTQRDFRHLSDGFDSHCAALLVSYLLQTRRIQIVPHSTIPSVDNPNNGDISHSSAAWSAFQQILSFLSEHDLLKVKLDFTKVSIESTARRRGIAGYYAGGTFGDSMKSTHLEGDSRIESDVWYYNRPLSLTHPIAPVPNASKYPGLQNFESANKSSDLSDVAYNALWRVGTATAMRLRREAQYSCRQLQQLSSMVDSVASSSCFEELLMHRRSYFEMHDAYFHFTLPENCSHVVASQSIKDEDNVALPLSAHHHCVLQYMNSIVELLEDGLNTRVVAVDAIATPLTTDVSSEFKGRPSSFVDSPHAPIFNASQRQKPMHRWVLSLGISINPEQADRRVDRAPATAQSPPTEGSKEQLLEQFRILWGNMVQLRRFKDGVISEAVVWQQDAHKASGGGSIIEHVVRYLLQMHLYFLREGGNHSIRAVTSQHFDNWASTHQVETSVDKELQATKYSMSHIYCRRAVEVLDKLRAILTSDLKAGASAELPLAYESLSAITPELRYTSLLPPTEHPLLSFINSSNFSRSNDGGIKSFLKKNAGKTLPLLCSPIRVIARLESSSKWPVYTTFGYANVTAAENSWAEAVRKLKLALLLRTRHLLLTHHQIRSTVRNDGCLDVCLDGYLFRVQPVAGNQQDVEARLLQIEERANLIMSSKLVPPLYSTLTWPVQHHQAIRSVQSFFPSYAGAVKLLVAWTAEHYFTDHLHVESIELIMAFVYIRSTISGQQPTSPMLGFLGALRLIAHHDWAGEPLIVDLSAVSSGSLNLSVGEMGDHEMIRSSSLTMDNATRDSILKQFEAVRNRDFNRHKINDSGEDIYGHMPSRSQLAALNTPMYIVSSVDKENDYWPRSAARSPEQVVFGMITQSACTSEAKLLDWISVLPWPTFDEGLESELVNQVMRSAAVIRRCDVILHFTRSIVPSKSFDGAPSVAQLKIYTNMRADSVSMQSLLVRESNWPHAPLQQHIYEKLVKAFHREAVFFWNGVRGESIGVLWRPHIKTEGQQFNILNCKHRTVEIVDNDAGHKSSLNKKSIDYHVKSNVEELLSQMLELGEGVLVQAEEQD